VQAIDRQSLQRRGDLVDALRRRGDAPAVITPAGDELSGANLAGRVADLAERLGPTRRLVLVRAANEVGPLVAYLAGLAGGHAVLLTGPQTTGGPEELVDRYRPDVVLSGHDDVHVEERHPGSAHELHPELALLLSTSGSTGSPKLVRLSSDNLRSNAEAIATYLELRPDDVALTTLPMQYCYGLSVINSHLLAGGAVALGSWSVVDPCLWERSRSAGVTSLAGVPHTFELLDRVGFDGSELPSLRRLTAAGGRLPAATVRRYAAVGRERGWDLFVMYGQTEATARMAYLPPHLAEHHPGAIGVPVPGGSIDLDPVTGATPDVGEIVYRGPNVMLGYAEAPADLALGRTVDALRTGDLGRRTGDGLLEVVGRRSRFVKPFGVRVDLDRLEGGLRDDPTLALAEGRTLRVTGDDHRVVVAIDGDPDTTTLGLAREAVRIASGLPTGAVTVVGVDHLPRLSSGKPDDAALRVLATEPSPDAEPGDPRDVLRLVLGVTDVDPGDTFVGLGGDSLSYVEASARLERLLGPLPPAWHLTPIGELTGTPATSRRRGPVTHMPTDVVLRAVAIVGVVSFHTRLTHVLGGAHVLLAIAGFNFARFQLAATERSDHQRRMWRSITRIAVPSVLFAGMIVALTDGATVANLLLVNNYFSGGQIKYWYVEVLLQLLVLCALAFRIPAIRRAEARSPWWFAMAAVAVALVFRHTPDSLLGRPAIPIFVTHVVAWLFVLGWAVERADTVLRRLTVSALAVAFIPGLFDELHRGLVVTAGVLVLVWLPRLPVPAGTERIVSAVAGASLWIYLTHWHVFPWVMAHAPPGAAVAASLAVGVGVWKAVERATARLSGRW
jgi:acyl-coenzyme A synthetase/AMP-(fatty) acid ligase